jgi:hypothetical protein
MHIKPSRKEFEVTDYGVRHLPTQYQFVSTPGQPTRGTKHMGALDKDLPNAPQYSSNEVEDMARRLWGEHLTASKGRPLL